jgi:hypothetical protein
MTVSMAHSRMLLMIVAPLPSFQPPTPPSGVGGVEHTTKPLPSDR